MQYVDCDRAEKHGDLCLGYGCEEIDEPCEQCKNCIKCEGGYYQLDETDKDTKIEELKAQIENAKTRIRVEHEKVKDKIDEITELKEQIEKIKNLLTLAYKTIHHYSSENFITVEITSFTNKDVFYKWLDEVKDFIKE